MEQQWPQGNSLQAVHDYYKHFAVSISSIHGVIHQLPIQKKCMGINQTDFQSKVNPVAYYVLFLKQKYKALMEDITANVEFERQN